MVQTHVAAGAHHTLAEILSLRDLGGDTFEASGRPLPPQRKFGGELLGQAAMAAALTVTPEHRLHAAQMHFLRPADSASPTRYVVTRLRDGGTFASRRVEVWQADRRMSEAIFSFGTVGHGFTHHDRFDVPELPENLPTPEEQLAGDRENLAWYSHITRRGAVEMRFPGGPLRARAAAGEATPRGQSFWLRSKAALGDDPALHQSAILYLTDYFMIAIAGMHHGVVPGRPNTRLATINHSAWFHGPARADEWLVHDQYTPWADYGRALIQGRLLDRSGRLIATTTQEGVVRRTGPSAATR